MLMAGMTKVASLITFLFLTTAAKNTAAIRADVTSSYPTNLCELEWNGFPLLQVLAAEVQLLCTRHAVSITEAKGVPVDKELHQLGATAVTGALDAYVVDADLLVDCTHIKIQEGHKPRRILRATVGRGFIGLMVSCVHAYVTAWKTRSLRRLWAAYICECTTCGCCN